MGSTGVMTDSYIGGIGSASFIPQDENSRTHPNQTDIKDAAADDTMCKENYIRKKTASSAWGNPEKRGNQTDEDKIINLTCTDEAKSTKPSNINKTEEYNKGYSGLSILPWEEFAFNPRVLNEMFYEESNKKITYDPDEVNVFFHGKNVMPPSVGDISENGKCWNIEVDNINDLRKVRSWLTEKCSIFGVTLLYKEKRFAKPERAPCLLMMDPSKGTIGDKLYTALTKAMDTLHGHRRFCVEINLNGCVERWCRQVLLTECKAVGAKLIITNGEEYTKLDGAEDIVCCVVCLPVWAMQTGIYKLHRKVVYDDFMVEFDADDLFLHGAFQDVQCQRQQIFSITESGPIFRTRSAAQTDIKTLQDLGSLKFVCVKKYDKTASDDELNLDDEYTNNIVEHNTTPFSELVMKRKDKVMSKQQKIKNKKKSKFSAKDGNLSDSSNIARKSIRFDVEETDNSTVGAFSSRNMFSKSNSFTNSTFEGSDDEKDDEPTSRIPQITSILCDNDDDSNDEECDRTETKRVYEVGGSGSFFSHRDEKKHSNSIRGMSVDLSLKESADYEQGGNNICNFKVVDTDTSDSELEEDESIQPVTTKTENNILDEMLKIDKTLPPIQKDMFKAKDIAEVTANEKSEKEKKDEKKSKLKRKVKVGRVLKDLTTVTYSSKVALPSSQDARYQEAKLKLKQGKKNITVSGEKEEPHTDNSNFNTTTTQPMTIHGIQNANTFEVEKLDEDIVHEMTPLKYSVHDALSKRGHSTKGFLNESKSPQQTDEIENFTAGDSSTDGEDVEIIYQSRKSNDSDTTKSDSGIQKDTDAVEAIASTAGIGQTPENTTNNQPKSEKKMKHFVQPDTNIIFQKHRDVHTSQLSDNVKMSDNVKIINSVQLIKSSPEIKTTKSTDLDIFEIEETDLELTDWQNDDIDMQSQQPKAAVPSLKLKSDEVLMKKSKRGTTRLMRDSSKGKYLGASVLPKSKITSKRS